MIVAVKELKNKNISDKEIKEFLDETIVSDS
jgi:hypothetical protein